ncbi:23262_t:CDS:1, partial [Gigaspora margarita]
MAQVHSFCISNIEKELDFFGKKLLYNNLQEQVNLATFLAKDNENITEKSEDTEDSEDSKASKIEATEYDPNLIKCFDVKNIVFLRNKIFQGGESDTDSEESQSDNSDKFDNNKLVGDKKIEQDVF